MRKRKLSRRGQLKLVLVLFVLCCLAVVLYMWGRWRIEESGHITLALGYNTVGEASVNFIPFRSIFRMFTSNELPVWQALYCTVLYIILMIPVFILMPFLAPYMDRYWRTCLVLVLLDIMSAVCVISTGGVWDIDYLIIYLIAYSIAIVLRRRFGLLQQKD